MNYAESYETILGKSKVGDYCYQQEKTKELLEIVTNILDTESKFIKSKNKLLLQAPTGSGKTVVSGGFIDSLFLNYTDINILWICETPNLTNQSKNKLKNIFGLRVINYENINERSSLITNSITFINWEKIKNTNARTDTNEKYSIDTMLKNSKQLGQKLIVVVDEAHSHTNSKLSKEFLDSINYDVILEITATPKHLDYDYIVDIPISDVKNSGFIKQGIVINDVSESLTSDYMSRNSVQNTTEYFILEGVSKRNYLKTLIVNYADKYDKQPLNPLLCIQLPNNNDEMQIDVEKFLATQGISRELGNLAVYMNGDYTDELDNIGKDENIEVLLFKQAIAKGWDCPRASVITFLRDQKSESFAIQTVGRILRMPYLEMYPEEFDELNHGYIYMEYENNILFNLKEKFVKDDCGLSIPIKKVFEETSTLNSLKKIVWSKTITDVRSANKLFDKDEVKDFLWRELQVELTNIDWANILDFDRKFSINIVQDKVDITSLDNSNFNLNLSSKVVEEFSISDLNTHLINATKKYKLDVDIFYDVIAETLCDKFDVMFSDEIPQDTLLNLYLTNINLIVTKIDELKLDISNNYLNTESVLMDWELPKKLGVKQNYQLAFNKLAEKYPYEDFWHNCNGLEISMINQLCDSNEINWWYKNGDNGQQHFSLAYLLDQKNRLFFPDFLAETDSKIFILETKGILGTYENVEKVKALRDYELRQNQIYNNSAMKQIVCGFVKEYNSQLYIYRGNDYEKEYNQLSNWELLKF